MSRSHHTHWQNYRLHRAIALDITLFLIIFIFYFWQRLPDSHRIIPTPNEEIFIIDAPPPIRFPERFVPYPRIPVEAEEDEELNDVEIIEDSILFVQPLKPEINEEQSLVSLDSMIFTLEEVDKKPELIKYNEYPYPENARRMQLTGIVYLKVLVNRAGEVEDVKIIHGHPFLNECALRTARSCKFEPAMKKGIPVKVWTELPVHFRLK